MSEKDDIQKGFVGLMPGEENPREPKTLDFFEECMKTKRILPQMKFTALEPRHGLWFFEGDIEVFMPVEETIDERDTKVESRYVSRAHIARSFSVIVYSVDRENNRVLVSYKRARDIMRPAELNRIKNELKEGNHPEVYARVTSMPEVGASDNPQSRDVGRVKNAYLDIQGLGIKGRLKEKDYGDFFVPDLAMFLSVNDVIKVAVTGEDGYMHRGVWEPRFSCSRREVVRNPWEFYKFTPGTSIRVICTTGGQRRRNKSGEPIWMGNFILDDGNKAISGKYSAPYGIRMEVGGTYEATVDKFDGAEKVFKIAITRPCGEEDVELWRS